MKSSRITLGLAALTVSLLPGVSSAQGFYGIAMIGVSDQATESEAYGNNIAVDPTFPSEFNTGDGTVGTIGVGYSFNGGFRVEGRLGYREGEFNSRELGLDERLGEEFILDGSIESSTLTVEGFYDFSTSTALKPYVKAGLGAARNRYAARLGGAGVAEFDPFDGNVDGFYDAYADEKTTEFTWNVGVGASYALTDKLSLIGEYQYVSLGDAQTGQDSFTDGFRVKDAAAHEVQIALKARF